MLTLRKCGVKPRRRVVCAELTTFVHAVSGVQPTNGGGSCCSWQVYWVGPILGAVLAAGLYEYLYCPDPELKKGLKRVFHKDTAGRYREVEAEDAAVKPAAVSDLERGEKKESFRDAGGEVLSSV